MTYYDHVIRTKDIDGKVTIARLGESLHSDKPDSGVEAKSKKRKDKRA